MCVGQRWRFLKAKVSWEIPLKNVTQLYSTSNIKSSQCCQPVSQSASQDGWVVNVFQQEKAKLLGKASSLESATFPCCSSSLQPTQEAAHGHKFESLTRCGFKTIWMSLSLPLPLSLLHTHDEMFFSFTLNSLLPFFPFQQIPLLMKMESAFSGHASNIIFLEA